MLLGFQTQRNAKTSKHINRELLTHKHTQAHKHTPTHTSRAGLWVTQCELETETGSERAAAGAVGWAGPYGEQQGAGGGFSDGGVWGGLRGDPEQGAACLIGAHLHSSGAGDT